MIDRPLNTVTSNADTCIGSPVTVTTTGSTLLPAEIVLDPVDRAVSKPSLPTDTTERSEETKWRDISGRMDTVKPGEEGLYE